MPLINRVSRLFRADLHAVLDRIEEPEVLLKQAVREMEEELGRDEQRVKLLGQEQEELDSRLADLKQSLQEIEPELDLCFASGKDDLARSLIKRKLEAQRYQKFLLRKRDSRQTALAELEARVKENRSALDGMRQKIDLLAEDQKPTQSDVGWSPPDVSVREEDIEVAFLREKQRRNAS